MKLLYNKQIYSFSCGFLHDTTLLIPCVSSWEFR